MECRPLRYLNYKTSPSHLQPAATATATATANNTHRDSNAHLCARNFSAPILTAPTAHQVKRSESRSEKLLPPGQYWVCSSISTKRVITTKATTVLRDIYMKRYCPCDKHGPEHSNANYQIDTWNCWWIDLCCKSYQVEPFYEVLFILYILDLSFPSCLSTVLICFLKRIEYYSSKSFLLLLSVSCIVTITPRHDCFIIMIVIMTIIICITILFFCHIHTLFDCIVFRIMFKQYTHCT